MEILEFRPRSKPASGEDAAFKRMAIQIAAQLPEKTDDALTVLRHCETLVRSFLGDPETV